MILGIVGKAGSGKSYVSKLLKENFKNSIVIDVDRVGHYVLTLFHVKEKLKDIFGQEIFDKNNEIDRKKLGEIVFSDESKLEKLNEIVHSEIYKEIEKKVKIYLKKYDIIVLDAAMLFKIGLDKMCHKIILVDASEDLRYKRLVKKRNITKEKAKNMIQSQKNLKFDYYDKKITANDNPEEIIEALENLINY
ncbi:dephospho-CoA kinase [Geotoga petraea]|jgi:dephospho-CoA kinase|uniref:Dephospho-CoA kinase n=1 Tax=Geotoga petraea TaxID=28234 RepID=A0A1G6PCH8_9BACT|nr:dephospho-CoA kinase [Geotoga petraea]MDK2946411.1 dephospho-CoA kinase [Geotoga sp.]TGG87974.1 dephospho-CoA kinase [Geotoga petraea]SDC77701.1 dephospho-CoA kinase [Geotoga petraea]